MTAQTILIKRSAVPGKAPVVADLALAELGLNTYDGKLFLRKNNGADSIIEIGSQTFTGDATGSGNGSIALTLANTAVTPGTFGSSSLVPVVTVDSKGRITSISTAAVASAAQAGQLATARTISATGDATWSVSFDGSTNVSAALTLANSGVGAGSYSKVTVDAKGRVTAGAQIASIDVTNGLGFTPVNAVTVGAVNGLATLDGTGKLTTAQIPASLVGAVVYQGVWNASTNSPTLVSGSGVKGQYYKVSVAGTTSINGHASWDIGDTIIFNGSVWDKIDGADSEVISVAGRIGDVILTSADVGLNNLVNSLQVINAGGAVSVASGLLASRPAFGTAGRFYYATNTTTLFFDTGAAWVVIQTPLNGDVTTASNTATLANTAVAAGSYGTATATPTFTVDSKGRLTAAGTATITPAFSSLTGVPTTIAGYGITDAQPLDGDLTAIAAIAATSGFLKKTAANTWSLDTNTYLTGNQTITVTGDATGSGTTAIALTLANSGVVAGTYSKVTVDAKGRVTVGAAIASGDVTTALGYTPVNPNTLGVANGVATLDATGRLPISQLTAAVVGAVVYQGVWNASTNSPALTGGSGTKGNYYKVSVAGTTSIDGHASWDVGDTIIFNGTTWDKIDGSDTEVTTVAGRVGAVVLAQADIAGLTTASSPTFANVTATQFNGSLNGNAATATTAGASTNDIGGVAGAIRYQTGVSTSGFSTAGTVGQILVSGGTGAPTWVNQNAITLQSSQVTTALGFTPQAALGFTPVNKAGDTMSGSLTVTGAVNATANMSASNFIKSVSVGLTAVGTTQGTALALTAAINVVGTSTAGTGLGVVMPAATAGVLVTVVNVSANAINVYPAAGAQIDSLGANVPFTLGVASKLEFVATSATQWYAMTGVYA